MRPCEARYNKPDTPSSGSSARPNHALRVGLDIYGTNVTADGIRRLGALKELTELYAGGTAADDASIAAISGLEKLFHLDLQGTRITDASLETIGKFKNLNSLNLSRTDVTGSTISKRGSLP